MNESERNQLNNVGHELGELKGEMKAYHQEHGRIHIENREDIKAVLSEVKELNNKVGIQNGRVTKVEQFIIEQTKMNSKLDGLLAAQWKRLEEQEKRHSYSMGMIKILSVLGGIILITGGYFFVLAVKDVARNEIEKTFANYDIIVK